MVVTVTNSASTVSSLSTYLHTVVSSPSLKEESAILKVESAMLAWKRFVLLLLLLVLLALLNEP